MDTLMNVLNIVGTIAFMISGALAAIDVGMDIGGIAIIAIITGVAGGTLRDLLLNREPVWMQHGWYIALGLFVAWLIFLLYQYFKGYLKSSWFKALLLISDSLGLIPFMLTGIYAGISTGQTMMTSVILGLITCVGGGICRDLFCQRVPVVFQEDYYCIPIILACCLYFFIGAILGHVWSIALSGLLLTTLRALAITYHLNAPKIKSTG